MSQQQLNNLMILHVHKDVMDQLDLKEIMVNFIGDSKQRLKILE